MQATGKGQTVVATFNLQGQGLYPLSDQNKQALLNAVNQTLAAKGTSVANITLGQVTVSTSYIPSSGVSVPRYLQEAYFCKHDVPDFRFLSCQAAAAWAALKSGYNGCAGSLCTLLEYNAAVCLVLEG